MGKTSWLSPKMMCAVYLSICVTLLLPIIQRLLFWPHNTGQASIKVMAFNQNTAGNKELNPATADVSTSEWGSLVRWKKDCDERCANPDKRLPEVETLVSTDILNNSTTCQEK